MIPSPKMIVLLDACVLYPAPVRDLFLSVAAEGLFNPVWSPEIQNEWINNLLTNRPDLKREQLIATTKAMNNAFPQANTLHYKHQINQLTLPDENDRHVLAAAIKAGAQQIITFNLKDFPPRTLGAYNLTAMHPDDFLCDLFDANPDLICEAFKKMVNRLKNPPVSVDHVLNIMQRLTLTQIAQQLKESWSH